MTILDGKTSTWAQGNKTNTKTVKFVTFDEMGFTKTGAYGDTAFNGKPDYPKIRQDFANDLKNVQDGLKKLDSTKDFGLGSGYRPESTNGHGYGTGADIKPINGTTWRELIDAIKNYGNGIDGEIHKNSSSSGQITLTELEKLIKQNGEKWVEENYHIDLKYRLPYRKSPIKKKDLNPNDHGRKPKKAKKPFDEAKKTKDPNRHDPLILDLNGDGIKTTSYNAGSYFDMKANGFAQRTGWVDENDGILAIDKNGNGIIDDSSELLGDQYTLKNGQKASDGFQALADLDDNHDGKIDSKDAAYSSLTVIKGDDTSHTLNELGINSINLNYTNTNTVDENGNIQIATSSYTKADGTDLSFGEYGLQVDPSDTIPTDDLDDSELRNIPDAVASGDVYDLHQAILKDASGNLKALVQTFVNETNDANRRNILDQILFNWTGSNGIDPNSRDLRIYYPLDSYNYNHLIPYFYQHNIDARELATLEKFMGEKFVSGYDGGPNPSIEAGDLLHKAYINLKEDIYAQLMAQTHLSEFFMQDVEEDGWCLTYDIPDLITNLQNRIIANPVAGKELVIEIAETMKWLGIDGQLDYQTFYDALTANDRELKWQIDIIGKSLNPLYMTNEGTGEDDAMRVYSSDGGYVHSLSGDDVVYGGDGNDTIGACSGDDLVDSWAGDDLVYGCDGNDTILGGSGADQIYGGQGNDVLNSGTENDWLYGGTGNDIYVFNKGDGQDTICSDDAGNDTIKFGQGITRDDLIIVPDGDNTVITYDNTGDSITILNQSDPTSAVENIRFADGSTYVLGQAANTVNGTEENDSLAGADTNGTVYGMEGNDTLTAGMSGTHVLYGGDGNDTYTINRNDGRVYIEDISGIDTILFGSGIYGNTEDDTIYGEVARYSLAA